MITEKQIKQIREAGANTVKIAELLNEWSNEIRIKELSKGIKIELTLENLKKEKKIVLATPIIGGVFAWHKDAWGRDYAITHVKTGLSLVCGKLKNIRSAIVYLNDNVNFWEAFTDNVTPLSVLNSQQFEIIKEANKIGKGLI